MRDTFDNLHDYGSATSDLAELERELEAARVAAAEANQKAQESVAQIADTFLVDKEGQPKDGVVYWYRDIAVVRHGDFLGILPAMSDTSSKLQEKLALANAVVAYEQPVEVA